MDQQILTLPERFRGRAIPEESGRATIFELDLRTRFESMKLSEDAAFLLAFQNDTEPELADYAYVDADDLARVGQAALMRQLRRCENLAVVLDLRNGQDFDAQWPYPAGSIHSAAFFTQTSPHMPMRFHMQIVHDAHAQTHRYEN